MHFPIALPHEEAHDNHLRFYLQLGLRISPLGVDKYNLFLVESRSNGDDELLKSSIVHALTKIWGERN